MFWIDSNGCLRRIDQNLNLEQDHKKMLGTYTTVDCPASMDLTTEEFKELKLEAFAWLKQAFAKIGGDVRILTNPHDFGPYPSFEIDYPDGMESVDEDNFDDEDADESRDVLDKEEWIGKAEKVIEEYNIKFEKYL